MSRGVRGRLADAVILTLYLTIAVGGTLAVAAAIVLHPPCP